MTYSSVYGGINSASLKHFCSSLYVAQYPHTNQGQKVNVQVLTILGIMYVSKELVPPFVSYFNILAKIM